MINELISKYVKLAQSEYWKYLNISATVECSCAKFKIDSEQFDERNLQAHKKAAEHYGKHCAYLVIIDDLRVLEAKSAMQKWDIMWGVRYGLSQALAFTADTLAMRIKKSDMREGEKNGKMDKIDTKETKVRYGNSSEIFHKQKRNSSLDGKINKKYFKKQC